MERFFISTIHVKKVRHLENLDIIIAPAPAEMRHLILTGKNGSGKTSLLEALHTAELIEATLIQPVSV